MDVESGAIVEYSIIELCIRVAMTHDLNLDVTLFAHGPNLFVPTISLEFLLASRKCDSVTETWLIKF